VADFEGYILLAYFEETIFFCQHPEKTCEREG